MADVYAPAARSGGQSPVTADALLADRQRFWGAFTSFTVGGIVTVVVVVLVVLYFIL